MSRINIFSNSVQSVLTCPIARWMTSLQVQIFIKTLYISLTHLLFYSETPHFTADIFELPSHSLTLPFIDDGISYIYLFRSLSNISFSLQSWKLPMQLSFILSPLPYRLFFLHITITVPFLLIPPVPPKNLTIMLPHLNQPHLSFHPLPILPIFFHPSQSVRIIAPRSAIISRNS